MGRLFFVAKNNMKKQKGDMITFFIMTVLSSFMIFLCLNMIVGTLRIEGTNKSEINGANIYLIKTAEPVSDFKIEEMIQGNPDFGDYEISRFLAASTAKYRKKGSDKWLEYMTHFACYEDERRIQTTSLDTSSFSGDDLILPVSLSPSFSIGDKIEIKISENIYEFTVAGFNEDFIYSSPMNLQTYLMYVSEKMYTEMEFENYGFAESAQAFKIQMSEDALKRGVNSSDASEIFYSDVNTWHQIYHSSHPDYAYELDASVIPADLLSASAMIMPIMFIMIILVFAFIIFAVALIVISFSTKNFILDNMRNTGIMQAGGYTVKEMVMILLVQLLIVSFSGSLIGTSLAALIQGKTGIVILYLLGLSWNQKPDPFVFVGVILIICSIISVFTIIVGRDYKKTSVLDALRGGINAHNFKKNTFPLDKTNLPLTIVLALKETFGKFKSQIGVVLIMAALSFCASMGFHTYESMGSDPDKLLKVSGMDMQDILVYGDMNTESVIKNFNCVENTDREYFTGIDFTHGNKTKALTTRTISDTSVMNPELMVEGRWPKYENEIALGTAAANTLSVEVGDSVILKSGEEEATYLVCGMIQTFQNMGQMGYMTFEGFERIGRIPDTTSIFIYLKKGYDVSDFEKEFGEVYPDTDYKDMLESTQTLFDLIRLSLKVIFIIILLVTAFITALAEALLIRTRISKEWRNLGVNKAMGFSSDQLIRQMMISNMPAILIGVALGIITVSLFGGRIFLFMYAIFGFRKIPFSISPVSYVMVTIIIVGVALLVSRIIGNRIKKLDPVKMITEE